MAFDLKEVSTCLTYFFSTTSADIEEVIQEIRELEKETEGLLDQILDFEAHR